MTAIQTDFWAQAMVPEVRGTTACAQAGFQVLAKTGSAFFWLHKLSLGALDALSYHGCCLVIFGHKRSESCFLYLNSSA